jgi:hypothetical protein
VDTDPDATISLKKKIRFFSVYLPPNRLFKSEPASKDKIGVGFVSGMFREMGNFYH